NLPTFNFPPSVRNDENRFDGLAAEFQIPPTHPSKWLSPFRTTDLGIRHSRCPLPHLPTFNFPTFPLATCNLRLATLPTFNLPTFRPSNLPTFPPSHLPLRIPPLFLCTLGKILQV
ncbi:MAG: hypothetical protein ACQKBT_12085, partial [Puniceicoccales bacterium]